MNQPSVMRHPDRAFVSGLYASMSLQPFMVFFSMIGFGSLARSQDFNLVSTVLSALGIYGMPGQVAMVELYATGAALLAILAAVSMANMRFLPMSVVLFPTFERSGRWFAWRYLIVQIMSVNSWSHQQHVAHAIPRKDRLPYFTAYGLVCFISGAIGSALGWLLASTLPFEITVSLIFLNPAYFIFLFCAHRNRGVIVSIVIGAAMGPFLFQLSPDWGLPICGIVAGTLGYWLTSGGTRADG